MNVINGRDLKRRRTGYSKPKDEVYRDVKRQNEYLLSTGFDGKGNYLYHRDSIRRAFDVGTQRLARLRKVVQEQSSRPFVKLTKEKVCRYSDVVLPSGCEEPVSVWMHSQLTGSTVTCRNKPERHGNARKKSNHAKGFCRSFLTLSTVTLAQMDPRKVVMVLHTTSLQSSPLLRTPNRDDSQYEYKCNHIVVHEFNRTLEGGEMGKISVGTFHSWLKQHRPYIGICPSHSDYCDQCKEFHEEIARARQIVNRLKQSGHSTEESICEQEEAMACYIVLLQEHKEKVQAGLEYYKKLTSETESTYKHICKLQQQDLTPEKSAELEKLKREFSAAPTT